MNVLWERHPLSATEVSAALPVERGWAQKTVNTFLSRLVQKGVLAATKSGKAYLYSPRLKREDCIAQESDSFLQRVFKGAAGPLVLHFCERAELSDHEIRELEALLRAKKHRR